MGKRGEKCTRLSLSDTISEKTGLDHTQARAVVDLVFEEIKAALERGGLVELRGFGTFSVKRRGARHNARNPRTQEPVVVESRGVVVFKPGRELHEAVKSLRQADGPGEET